VVCSRGTVTYGLLGCNISVMYTLMSSQSLDFQTYEKIFMYPKINLKVGFHSFCSVSQKI
jgi:hypothetical protein